MKSKMKSLLTLMFYAFHLLFLNWVEGEVDHKSKDSAVYPPESLLAQGRLFMNDLYEFLSSSFDSGKPQRARGTGPFPNASSLRTSPGEVCACRSNPTPDSEDTDRIVGGMETASHQYPSMALLLLDGSQLCAGNLLNSQYVLTAGHCVNGRGVNRLSVILGAHNLRDAEETGRVRRRVRRAMYHPNYNTRSFNNDFAVLELVNSVEFSSNIQPNCIPLKPRNYTGQTATVVGWGRIGEDDGTSAILRHVSVPVVANRQCVDWMNNGYDVTDNMICAGYKQGGKDACGGDSGGPLFSSSGSLQVGIVSFGEGCARPNDPGVYSRVDRVGGYLLKNMPLVQTCKLYSPDTPPFN